MYVKSGDLYGFLNSSGQEILRPEYNQSDYLETGELHRFRKMGKVTTLIQIIINAGSGGSLSVSGNREAGHYTGRERWKMGISQQTVSAADRVYL